MFVLYPIVLFARLMSVLTALILTSLYGLSLIMLVLTIRNARQETSRATLVRFLKFVALDHFLVALMSIIYGIFLANVDDARIYLPMLEGLDPTDNTMVIVLWSILAFIVVVCVLLGALFWLQSRDMESHIPVQRQETWGGWHIALLVIGAVLNISTAFFLLAIASPLIWHMIYIARMSRQSSLVWTLTIAVRQGLPLGPEIRSLADGLWGHPRQRLIWLAENLEAGVTLSTALERQPGLVPRSAMMMIRMGEETDMLIPALESCAVGYTRKHDRQVDLISTQHGFMLLVIPLVGIPMIISFLSFNIVPKFKKIFLDFGTELPSATTMVMHFVDESGGFFLYFLGSMTLIGLIVYLSLKDWERDWPLLNLLAPRINGPPILRGLALLIQNKRPLPAGIQGLIWSHPRPSARERLKAIHRQIIQGTELAVSLADNKLIRRGDVALLRAAEKVQNLPWSLEQLADSMENRFWYRLRILLEFGQPATVILMGLIVATVAMAFFMPMIKLLNDLS